LPSVEKKQKKSESNSQDKEYALETLEEGCQRNIHKSEQTFTSIGSVKGYFMCTAHLKQKETNNLGSVLCS